MENSKARLEKYILQLHMQADDFIEVFEDLSQDGPKSRQFCTLL